MAKILIVDDESGIRSLLNRVLRKKHDTREASNGREAVACALDWKPDVIICDLKMPEMDGIEVLKFLGEKGLEACVIVLTAHGTVETAVQAMKLGAFDYLRKPFDVEEVQIVVDKALEVLELKDEVRILRKQIQKRNRLECIVGKAPAMQKTFDLIEQFAPARSTILILGESGTGKELIARAIHSHSPRSEKRFVAVNCAAIAEELLESELFGHEKGSFTGAVSAKTGKFELAHGGTIFLDEIGEMSPRLQAKLLRVLQEGEIDRVGGNAPVPVDVRVVASTNRNLREEIRKGNFREDLFYRLNVVTLGFPPLRERKEDLPLLVDSFLARYAQENGKPGYEMAPESLEILMQHHWPGNVRELENTIERACILARDGRITPTCLPEEITTPDHKDGIDIHVGMTVADAERVLILETLKACGNNRVRSIELLGISVRTLRNKISEYRSQGINVP